MAWSNEEVLSHFLETVGVGVDTIRVRAGRIQVTILRAGIVLFG